MNYVCNRYCYGCLFDVLLVGKMSKRQPLGRDNPGLKRTQTLFICFTDILSWIWSTDGWIKVIERSSQDHLIEFLDTYGQKTYVT